MLAAAGMTNEHALLFGLVSRRTLVRRVWRTAMPQGVVYLHMQATWFLRAVASLPPVVSTLTHARVAYNSARCGRTAWGVHGMMLAGEQERQDADQERPQWPSHGSDAYAPDARVSSNAAAAPCEAAAAHGCVLYVQAGWLATFRSLQCSAHHACACLSCHGQLR